jgi:ATP-dependent Clp protease adaptor protein ClpS
MESSGQTVHEEASAVLEATTPANSLIVHNDEFNTFDWVIKALVDVCKHTREQAEQCAYIIHSKGRYAVKHGMMQKLKPMKDEISDRGIGVTIE